MRWHGVADGSAVKSWFPFDTFLLIIAVMCFTRYGVIWGNEQGSQREPHGNHTCLAGYLLRCVEPVPVGVARRAKGGAQRSR
jgi:hypothetical protein